MKNRSGGPHASNGTVVTLSSGCEGNACELNTLTTVTEDTTLEAPGKSPPLPCPRVSWRLTVQGHE